MKIETISSDDFMNDNSLSIWMTASFCSSIEGQIISKFSKSDLFTLGYIALLIASLSWLPTKSSNNAYSRYFPFTFLGVKTAKPVEATKPLVSKST